MSNNYCSQKFWWLSVDIEKQTTNSCCTATSDKIDKTWLANNPGQLFNTPKIKQERELLLNDKRVPSCDVCWRAEDRGTVSRRQLFNSAERTHENIQADPEILNILIGSDCNLTCLYCCKQYSSAWAADVINNGNYGVSDPHRYTLTEKDKIIYNLSQKEIMQSPTRKLIIDEVGLLSTRLVVISGGEPFLNLDLFDLISKMSGKQIQIVTGLGVNENRFKRELEKISSVTDVQLLISAESIGAMYEFNRYGSSYNRFCNNLETIKQMGIPYKFNAVVSNTTVFGLMDFINEFNESDIEFNACTDPDFLSVNVLDDASKQVLLESLPTTNTKLTTILTTLKEPCTLKQQQEAGIFITEFARRRNLSVNIFPESFIKWINNGVV